MHVIINAVLGLAMVLMARNALVEAHDWVKGEVLRKIAEGERHSLVEYTEKLTGRKSMSWVKN